MMEDRLLNDANFSVYKQVFTEGVRAVLQVSPERSLDEAAFPAYAHPNKFIHSFYWTRLRAVMQAIDDFGPLDAALDFGCGSGVMLPFLAHRASTVIGADLNLEPSQKIQEFIRFPDNIRFLNTAKGGLDDLKRGSFSLVTAMNVFEHMANPRDLIDLLFNLLHPGGYLVVSLPKENKVYQLARKLAGREFTGDYHETNYQEIERFCAEKGSLTSIISFPFDLVFRIFYIRKS